MSVTALADGRLIDVNQSLLRLSGYTREELIGRSSVELGIWAHPEDRAKMVALVREKKYAREVECQLKARNGELRTVLASFEALEFDGQQSVLLSAFDDITARRNLEEQLRQSQKMEAVGQLAAGVAHDFNNLLTIILGHVGLLLEDPAITGEVRESLDPVAKASERAAGLTRQLLAFSRRQVMSVRPADLNDIVNDTAGLVQRLLGETVSLRFHYCPNPAMVEADRSMIEQVILNLAVNARDAMPQGGQLTVGVAPAAAIVPPGLPGGGKFVCLTMADNGKGMDDETKARIFEPFFTTKDVGKGRAWAWPRFTGSSSSTRGGSMSKAPGGPRDGV